MHYVVVFGKQQLKTKNKKRISLVAKKNRVRNKKQEK